MTAPRSHVLPLCLILLLCLATCFISNSLHKQVQDLQAQIDAVAIDQTFLTKCAGEAVGQLSANDTFLAQQQQAIIKEVKRLGMNQEALIIQSLELPPEETK